MKTLLTLLLLTACAAGEKPNILIISIDDLNDWTGSLGGHPQARTPHIDRLAERGTLFANAHCQAPICTPSRASMVTGLLPSTTGLYFLQPGLESSPRAKRQPTLMATLQANGYRTMSAGKFVKGRNEGPYFDDYGGDCGGFGPNPEEKIHCPHGGINWDWGAYPETNEQLPDHDVADWVVERLESDHEQPFLLVAGFWRPHVPMYAPQEWHDLFPADSVKLPEVLDGDRDDLSPYALDLTNGEPAPRHSWFVEADMWRSAVRSYLASIAFVDSQVGRVLDALDASPHRDDTIVVLLSDHGFHLGEKQRWAKRALWTDSTRVPLILDAPGMPAGEVTRRPAGLVDLYPTLLELTGIDAAGIDLDGHSLVPQLRDPDAPRRQPAICTFGPANHSLHFTRWHYLRYADGSEELYDLENDPHEWHNLADRAEHAERIAGFRKHLPKTDAEPILAKHWNRWEVADWRTAEKNAGR